MDILNFISWIAGKKRIVTSVPDDALVPIGIRTPQRDDDYTTVAIKKSDLITTVPLNCCPVIDANGNVIIDDTSNETIAIMGPPINFTQVIPNFSGMLIVNDHYDGGVEMWICGGGTCTLVSSTAASAGGGIMAQNGNGYEWSNAQALQGPFTFTVIKTRNGA